MGSGIIEEGRAILSIGSSGVVLAQTNNPQTDQKEGYIYLIMPAQTVVAATINKINISSNIVHIIIYSNNGKKKSCNCSGSRCKYNKKQKHSKNETNVKLITKNFVALGFKAKMVINAYTQLPLEVILTPKE